MTKTEYVFTFFLLFIKTYTKDSAVDEPCSRERVMHAVFQAVLYYAKYKLANMIWLSQLPELANELI